MLIRFNMNSKCNLSKMRVESWMVVSVSVGKYDDFVDLLTWIWLSIAVGTCWWCSVTCFHFQCISALLFTIEHDFCEYLTALQVNLEEFFAFVARRIDDVVINLFLRKNKTKQIKWASLNGYKERQKVVHNYSFNCFGFVHLRPTDRPTDRTQWKSQWRERVRVGCRWTRIKYALEWIVWFVIGCCGEMYVGLARLLSAY